MRFHGLAVDKKPKGKSKETVLSEGDKGTAVTVTSTCGPDGCNGCPSFAVTNGPEIRKTATRSTCCTDMAFSYMVKPQPALYKIASCITKNLTETCFRL